MRKLSAVIGAIALAMCASADVRNIRPPTTGEGKLGTTSYKWGEIHAEDGYYSSLFLGSDDLTDLFISPADAPAGDIFYADGAGGGMWGEAGSPTNGITQAEADILYPRKGTDGTFNGITYSNGVVVAVNPYYAASGEMWYGVEWTTDQSEPDLTRIGNFYLHRSLPLQSQVYACALQDDGTESYIYNPTNWNYTLSGEAATIDGTDGQVMIHFPEYWRQDVAAGTYRATKISPVEQAGWEYIPEQYISAFEATVYRAAGVTTNLASVVNTNTTYRGGNNNAALDGTAKSFLGRPATNLSRTQFRTYARARGTGWEMYNYDAHRTITTFFLVEYATRNSQKAVNTTLDANGFKQGGLGGGVTTLDYTAWTAFNGQCPFVPCGTASSIGTGTGEVTYNLPAAFSNTVSSVKVPVYRGIENPFGHIWKNCDGINVQIFANGEPDPSSYAWISSDPDTWNDSNYTGYKNVGKLPRSNGFSVSMLLGHILPSAGGGSNLTYWCDGCNASPPESGSSLRAVRFGGSAYTSSSAGFGSMYLNNGPAEPNANFGARLCYIPQ